ncbi:MAG: GFA family protein [Brevundimonas sp.]|nr:MAG: GFA family protein [Brevundimonas sp.]
MITGRCHCGDIAFEIDGEIPEDLTRCTCSFCSKRGHLYAYFAPDQFRRVFPQDRAGESTYFWNSKLVANNFCGRCGCDVYADSPVFIPEEDFKAGKRRIAVNARLFDDFEAADHPVTVIDGKNLW